jgi:hypothetical protein
MVLKRSAQVLGVGLLLVGLLGLVLDNKLFLGSSTLTYSNP